MDVWIRLELWGQLAQTCGLSTLEQGLEQLWGLLLLCLLCRLTFRLGCPSTLKHVLSALAGVCSLFLFFRLHVLWVLLLCALSYLVLLLNQRSDSRGIFLSLLILIFLLTGKVRPTAPETGLWTPLYGSTEG